MNAIAEAIVIAAVIMSIAYCVSEGDRRQFELSKMRIEKGIKE